MDQLVRMGNRGQQQFGKVAVALAGFLGLLAVAGDNGWGQAYQVLHRFESSDGRGPHAPLVVAGGTLYGTIVGEGGTDLGEVFQINTDGTGFIVLKQFTGFPGGLAYPQPALILSGTILYGTTVRGGTSNPGGTIFKIDLQSGGFTVLKGLDAHTDGSPPLLNLVDGNTLYGTAYAGGSPNYYGTIFKIDIDGSGFTVLKTFAGPDGIEPYKLVRAGTMLYGTTALGGNYSKGTVFRLNTDGTGFAVLKHLTGADAAYPADSLVLSGTTLYGATYGGGTCCGTLFRIDIDGSGYSVLKAFDPKTDGDGPYGDLLVIGTTLYGTAEEDGPAGGGTVFKMGTDGNGFTVLNAFGVPDSSFEGPADGALPTGALVFSGRTLYGTTLEGGLSNGTIFSLQLPVTAPNLVCPGTMVLDCTNGGATAALDVELSDSSGSPVVVIWSVDGTPYQTNNVPSTGTTTATNLTFTAEFGSGTHLVAVSASNGETAPATCSTVVQVKDMTPPQILSISATPNRLWPPNHRLVAVSIEVEAQDNCGGTASKIVAVTSNEPGGNAKEGPDWLITGALTVDLRAERLGNGPGRIYTIWVECVDGAGNSSFGSVNVTVPHSNEGTHSTSGHPRHAARLR